MKDLYELMLESPPLFTVKQNGAVIRWYGALHRCAFWDGYDLMTVSPHKGQATSLARKAYNAGKAYRKLVDSGKRDPLPSEGRPNYLREKKS